MNEHKTYLIAGASSGIGLALSEKLAGQGHKIIAVGRTEYQMAHANVNHFYHDFASNEPLPEIASSIDGMVYCPGTINLKPFSAIRDKDVLADFNVNVVGAFRFIHQYRALLSESREASIVLFSSVAAKTGMAYHTNVSISKGAIEGLTLALAAEFAPKIRVNCIAPSLTDTPLAATLLNSDAKRLANADRHPLKRIGTAQEVADLTIFLLNAEWITGQIIGINGGLGTILK